MVWKECQRKILIGIGEAADLEPLACIKWPCKEFQGLIAVWVPDKW